MIYSHYSEYMAIAISTERPSFDEGEREFLEPYLASNEEPFLELACGYGRLVLPIDGIEQIRAERSPCP